MSMPQNLEFNHLPDVIESAPAVAFRLSHKEDSWRTWFVSENVSMFGYERDDFLSDTIRWFDLVHPDDKVLLSKTVNDYEQHNVNNFKLYYRLITKKGDVIPVTEYNKVHRDESGNVVCYDTYIISSAQSETDRRLLDDHFRQQAVLNDILMSLHDSNLDNALQIILDRTGEYLDTSRALLFKDSPDHRTCKIVYEWCNRDIDSVMALDYNITYETGMPEIYVALQTTGNLLINHGEIPENCKEEFDAEGLIASAIFAVYLNGDHYGFVCFDDCIVERTWDEDTVRFLKNIANIISTVLARQDAAKRLAQNQKTYEAVLNNIDSYIFVTDPVTQDIIFANKSFKDAFGDECSHKAEACLALVRGSELGGNGRGHYPEIYCERTNEWVSVACEEITWIDGRKANLVTCYDITAKKNFADTLEKKIEERTRELQLMTEEAQRAKAKAEDADLAKSHFLANMSHEIRTPMNAILGLAEVLSDSSLGKVQREHVRNIRRSSEILLNIINDILDISKMEAGKLSLIGVNYNLRQTLDHVVSLLRGTAEGKGVEFRFSSDCPPDLYLFGDDIRLRQVLINILSNAVKFTQEGHVEFSVDAGTVDAKDITFRISDTGAGIQPEDIAAIFEPFSQADIHKNRKIQGTGLGLPICRNLVEMMHGSIDVQSEYGKGSTFTIVIPKVLGSAEGVHDDSLPRVTVHAPEAKVLVVDDIDVNLYVAEALLEENDIKPLLAASGKEAVTLAEQNDLDIIFMDHMMPEMNGIDAALAIRQLEGPRGTVPIIMLTANVLAEARNAYDDAGMNDFLAKPIEPEKLNALLQKWLPPAKVESVS